MNRRRKHPRGIALMLVVAAVALASVLGFVMLSSAALQTRAAANQGRLTAADYLAESGLNIAMYYLQYPEKAPGYAGNFGGVGYWNGTGGYISIGSAVDGTVDVTVTRDASDIWTYEVVSTAKTGTNSQTQITKQTGARVYVRNEYVVKHAAAFNGNTVVQPYMTFVGDVWAAKNFAMRSTAPAPSISGTIYAKTLSPIGVGYQNVTSAGVPTTDFPAPSTGTNGLNKYVTYTVNDVTYSRDTISASSISSTTLGTTTSNPAGIYYKDATSGGDFQILDNVTINGTLVVDGNVRVRGTGIVINAQTGYPGLIVTGNLQIEQPSKNLTVNGICYIGGQLQTSTTVTPSPSSLISKLTINGALLTGTTGSSNTMTGSNVTTVVTYNAAKAKAPEMTANYRVPKGVSIVRWGLP
jgi:hypothetical protein